MNLRSTAAADAVGAAVPCVHAPWSDHNITDSYCCCCAHTGTGQGGGDSGVENSRKERVMESSFREGSNRRVRACSALQKLYVCSVAWLNIQQSRRQTNVQQPGTNKINTHRTLLLQLWCATVRTAGHMGTDIELLAVLTCRELQRQEESAASCFCTKEPHLHAFGESRHDAPSVFRVAAMASSDHIALDILVCPPLC